MKKKIKIILLLAAVAIIPSLNLLNISLVTTNSRIQYSAYDDIVVKTSLVSNISVPDRAFSQPYNIVIHGLNNYTNPGINSSAYQIDVYVEEKTSLGALRFLPIYKPIQFSSTVYYKWHNPLGTVENRTIETTGHHNVFGTWSFRKAELETQRLINNHIVKKIHSDIRKKLNS